VPTHLISDFTHTIQFDVGRFLGPSGGIDDYVNHSCDPTCALRATPRRLALVARRDIAPGDELTFDYSTCLVDEPPLPVCHCGAPMCRGQVASFWSLPPRTRKHLLAAGAVPSFVLGRHRARVNARA